MAQQESPVVMVDELLILRPHQLSFPEAGLRIMITPHFSPRTRLSMAGRVLISEVRYTTKHQTLSYHWCLRVIFRLTYCGLHGMAQPAGELGWFLKWKKQEETFHTLFKINKCDADGKQKFSLFQVAVLHIYILYTRELSALIEPGICITADITIRTVLQKTDFFFLKMFASLWSFNIVKIF